jgi:Integrase zinc binding domain
MIPQSDNAHQQDNELLNIESFLCDPVRPPKMEEEQFCRFVKKASRFFILEGKLWKCDSHGKHPLIIPETKHLVIIQEAHDTLGHKGLFSVQMHLLDRFWWPMLENDVKWYICTCHECQVHLLKKIHIPPSVPTPASLFCKAYIDMFFMPKAGGYHYITHAQCSLSSYPEWCKLHTETGATLGAFIFQEILCHWGALKTIVTDNGPAFIKALD